MKVLISHKHSTHFIYSYTECHKNVPNFRYVPLRLREQEHTEERQQELGKVILAQRQAERFTKNVTKKTLDNCRAEGKPYITLDNCTAEGKPYITLDNCTAEGTPYITLDNCTAEEKP